MHSVRFIVEESLESSAVNLCYCFAMIKIVNWDIKSEVYQIMVSLLLYSKRNYSNNENLAFILFILMLMQPKVCCIYVRLRTEPVPPNRPIPTNGPILTTGPIVSSFPTNGLIFSTTRPTFKRHLHKWAERNVKRYVFPRQYDEELIEILVNMYLR